ncbi:hypothetical protein K488DRAFT_82821 [Vararia minispora EC-137]|uniref:Uncharacterized protein n=1 Tax=Vararia minispora EC-137 TaxID=1314806 RepID=A0ACB8QVS0_9AGAM|nr:hypothetical protein K488DRAFT_82821 [Vararia minispora EC-137]
MASPPHLTGRHTVKIGQTLRSALQKREGGKTPARPKVQRDFYPLRYTFKPKRLDDAKTGMIESVPSKDGKEGSKITVERPMTDSDDVHVWSGNEVVSRQWDCVLIYDEELGTWTLEKVASSTILNYEGHRLPKAQLANSPIPPTPESRQSSVHVRSPNPPPPKREEREDSDDEPEVPIAKVAPPTRGSVIKQRTPAARPAHSPSKLATVTPAPRPTAAVPPAPRQKLKRAPVEPPPAAPVPPKRARPSPPPFDLALPTDDSPDPLPPSPEPPAPPEPVAVLEEEEDDGEWEPVEPGPEPALAPTPDPAPTPTYQGEDDDDDPDNAALEQELNDFLASGELDASGEDDEDDMEPVDIDAPTHTQAQAQPPRTMSLNEYAGGGGLDGDEDLFSSSDEESD